MIQTLLDAISLGGTYALAAVGIGLVFGVMRLVNFAHSELITIAAYIMVVTNDLPLIVSIVLALTSSALLAIFLELVAYRRLRGSNPGTMLIVSFGISVLLQKVFELIFGALPRSAAVAPSMNGSFSLGGISITKASVATIVLTIIVALGMGYLVEFTNIGLQLRAAASGGSVTVTTTDGTSITAGGDGSASVSSSEGSSVTVTSDATVVANTSDN